MAKIKVDATGIDTGGFGPPMEDGTHKLKLVQATVRKKNAGGDPVNDMETVWEKDSQHSRIWEYIPLNKDASNAFRLAQFLDAMGLGRKAEFDPKTLEGKTITARTVIEARDGFEPRARIRDMFKPVDEDGAEPSEDGAEPAEGGGEGPYGRAEIESWDDDDIKGYAEELGVDMPKGHGWRSKLLDELVAAEAGEDESEAEDEPEAEAESTNTALMEGIEQEYIDELSADAETYSDWTAEDVDWMVEGLGIGGNIAGRKTVANKVRAIVGFAEEALGAPSGDGDDEAEPDQYDDNKVWSNEDLLAEINSRVDQGADIEISGRKTRDKMIAALRKDDEPF